MSVLKQDVTPTTPAGPTKTPVLKPVPQPVAPDFVEMRRNAIKRFPKTLARLAE